MDHRPDLTGIVLAGGRSSRMGTDKAFVRVEGRPMILRVLAALGECCSAVVIVTKDPLAYAHLGVPVVTDERPDQSPAVGLASGLRAVSTPWAFVASCDLPFLVPEAIRLLARLADGWDAAVPEVDGIRHPLHAVYAVSCLPVVENQVSRGVRRMTEVLDALRLRLVGGFELQGADPTLLTLRNINTPDDLRALRLDHPEEPGG